MAVNQSLKLIKIIDKERVKFYFPRGLTVLNKRKMDSDWRGIWCFSIWPWSFASITVTCIVVISSLRSDSISAASTRPDSGPKSICLLALSMCLFLLEKSIFRPDRFWWMDLKSQFSKREMLRQFKLQSQMR